MLQFIDTHAHLDGEEFAPDRDEVVKRAREAGVSKIFVPAIDLPSVTTVLDVCRRYPGYAFPMIGLHPEEVRADWRDVLAQMKPYVYGETHPDPPEGREPRPAGAPETQPDLFEGECRPAGALETQPDLSQCRTLNPEGTPSLWEGRGGSPIAIGEVGLDYYWSREFEHEQMEAFEEQVRWSVEMRLPLMIHCRKAQNEMVRLLRQYERDLPGGVFHCFTGNAHEAEELLRFDRFVLGIGGVLTFKKSILPETLAAAVPLDRIVLETDSPYMAPVPMRGKRNESAFVLYVLQRMAQCYGISEQQLADITTANVQRVFGV